VREIDHEADYASLASRLSLTVDRLGDFDRVCPLANSYFEAQSFYFLRVVAFVEIISVEALLLDSASVEHARVEVVSRHADRVHRATEHRLDSVVSPPSTTGLPRSFEVDRI